MLEKMWNLMSIPEPKFGMQKGCFHTSFPLGAVASDKQFPLFKPEIKSTVCHNYNSRPKPDLLENSSQIMDVKTTKNPEINHVCNSKKKKKKRRRRRKKQQTKNARQRQVSVCESEDSFVIFFADDKEELLSETTEGFDSCDSLIPIKKVRFASDSKLCEVHPMIMWSYAYQAARKGPWEEHARDRDRFNKRVRNTEAIIGHVFSDEHRSKIYHERFASL